MQYNGPVKCVMMLKEPQLPGNEPPKINIEYEYQNGDKVSANEIDIGQTEWEHAIPLSPVPLTWKLNNYTPDIPDSYWQRRCFATMFRSVGLIIPQKFKFVANIETTSFFNIEFTDDLEVFDGRPGVLAQAYLFHPQNNPRFNGLQQWNDNHFFTPFGDELPAWLVDPDNFTENEKFANGNIKTLSTQPMLQIGMHELDHNMGFRHDLNSEDSMLYPFVKRGVNTYFHNGEPINEIIEQNFKRSPEDLDRYELKYGRRSLFQWFNRMRARRVKARRVHDLPYWVSA